MLCIRTMQTRDPSRDQAKPTPPIPHDIIENFMIRSLVFAGIVCLACLSLSVHGEELSREEQDAGFKPMFNGQDFTGWRFTDGKEATDVPNWKVADGIIRLSGGGAPHLCTSREYGDFEMRFEWRSTQDNYNSGFFIRSGKGLGTNQLNLAKGGEGAFIGGKIDGAKAVPGLQKPAREWNEWQVVAQGDKVTFTCNGKPAWVGTGLKSTTGYIGLHAEGAGMEFRKLRIREIQ